MLKEKLLLLCVLFSYITYSQNYNFNLQANYNLTTVNGSQYQKIVLSNTNDDDIFLTIGGFNGKLPTATLIDFKKNKYHKFAIIITKNNIGDLTTFKYQFTSNIKIPREFSKYNFDFKEISSEENYKKVKLLVYKKSKKKKPKATYTLTLEKSNGKSFGLYRVSCLHPFEFFNKIKYNRGYIVTNASGRMRGGKNNAKLLSTKNINLKIVIPNK